MTPPTIAANLKAKTICEERPGGMLRSHIEPTRAEQGCIHDDLHRSLWEAYMKSPQLVGFGAKQGASTGSWGSFVGETV